VPPQIIDKGIPTAALMAHVLVAKYMVASMNKKGMLGRLNRGFFSTQAWKNTQDDSAKAPTTHTGSDKPLRTAASSFPESRRHRGLRRCAARLLDCAMALTQAQHC